MIFANTLNPDQVLPGFKLFDTLMGLETLNMRKKYSKRQNMQHFPGFKELMKLVKIIPLSPRNAFSAKYLCFLYTNMFLKGYLLEAKIAPKD